MSIESNFNSFSMDRGFNTRVDSSHGEVLINLNVCDEWYKKFEKNKYIASWADICWTLKKTLLNF
jgi:hypothetical protein